MRDHGILQSSGKPFRVVRGLRRRLTKVRRRATEATHVQKGRRPAEEAQSSRAREVPRTTRRSDPSAERAQLLRARRDASALLESLTAQRDQLRANRLEVQRELGAQHGKRVWPRMRVEKTNGTASFVAQQRMMQRIHRRALDPLAGIDRAGAVFDRADPSGLQRFARSHGVPVATPADPPNGDAAREPNVVVHAFKGEVGLVELRRDGRVRHLDAGGADPGDIRPAVTYDSELPHPEGFEDIVQWSRTLSAHIPRPYVQVAFGTENGSPAVEHIDVDPERIPVLTPEWDERLGGEFDHAYSRFLLQPYRAGGLANRVPGGIFSYQETR